MKKIKYIMMVVCCALLIPWNVVAQVRDTMPRFGLDMELGAVFSSLSFFNSHIRPFTSEGKIEQDRDFSFAPSGYYFSMGLVYWFGRAFGVELDGSFSVNKFRNKYRETHIIERLHFSEQEWTISLSEAAFTFPVVGLLQLDDKKRWTLGIGPYVKLIYLDDGIAHLKHTFYADEYNFLDEPYIHYLEMKYPAAKTTKFGWMVQVEWKRSLPEAAEIFLKVYYQKDFTPFEEEPYIHQQRVGLNVGYRLLFEKTN
jgi:hypothetical protein